MFSYGRKTELKSTTPSKTNDLISNFENTGKYQPNLYPKLLFNQRIEDPYGDQHQAQFQFQIEKKEIDFDQIPLIESVEIPRGNALLSTDMNTLEAQLQESVQVPRRPLSLHPDYSQAPRREQDFGKRRMLRTQEGTSFAGALLQCLYHLPRLKALLFEYENENKRNLRTIVAKMFHFFKSMEKSDADGLNKSADELIKYVAENYQNKYDGRSFWQALYNGLGRKESLNKMPFLNLFEGQFRKIIICKVCRQSKETPLQKLTTLNLEETDFTGDEIESKSFFSTFKPFICGCHDCDSQYSTLMIEKFPEIAVLAIHPGTLVQSKAVKLLPRITIKSSGDKIGQAYDYCAGVLTKEKTEDGGHSIAIIQCGGNKNSYYKFAENVEQTKLDSTDYHPRLLFYCKSQ